MKNKSMILSVIGLALLVGVSSQVSVLALGDEKAGSTVLVRRTRWLNDLRLIDSGQTHCVAAVGDVPGSGETPSITMRRIAAEACHDQLAIRILDEKRALARFGFSSMVQRVSEIGRQ